MTGHAFALAMAALAEVNGPEDQPRDKDAAASVRDEHYAPRRAMRPKTAAENQFCALGPVALAFHHRRSAAGSTRLGPKLGPS
jgi:hypothetical protein